MKWLDRVAERFAARALKGMTSLELFREIYGGRESRAGVAVNAETALKAATVLACLRVISEGLSQVPFRVYRREGQGRRAAEDHPLNRLLTGSPNAWQTSFELRETLGFHVGLTGNCYIFVNRVGRDREIRELIPIEPGRVAVERRDDGGLVYKVTPEKGGAAQIFGADAIWHVRGASWNGWVGMDALKLAGEAIGLSVSIEQTQADFQRKGMRPSGVLSYGEKLSPERFQQLKAWVDSYIDNEAGRPLIMDGGAEFHSMMATAADQQLLETRKHQIEEICRAFRVLPIMVGHADKTATYASAEQMFRTHVIHTLGPWYARVEESANAQLLSPEDRAAGFYTKFQPNALMRAAPQERGEYYTKALGSGGGDGWMTPNEIRALEELDPHGDGDELPRRQAAPAPADAPDPPADPEQPED